MASWRGRCLLAGMWGTAGQVVVNGWSIGGAFRDMGADVVGMGYYKNTCRFVKRLLTREFFFFLVQGSL